MHAYSDEGSPIAATFSIEKDADYFAVILESRSGPSRGNPARNPEYNVALELLLVRLAGLRATLWDAFVDSAVARRLPKQARRILDAPVGLDDATDVHQMRMRLSVAASGVGREPGAAGEGNRTKRIRLIVTVPGHEPYDSRALQVVLARPPMTLDPSPAAIGGFLRDLIGLELLTISDRRINVILAVRANDVLVATDEYLSGQTVPVASVATAMETLRRDGAIDATPATLGNRSSFIGAVLLQLPGARVVDTKPPQIVIVPDASQEFDLEEQESVRAASIPGPFQGALNRLTTVRQRREQSALRMALLHGRDEAACALCGELFPSRFLWASHIKKRAATNEDEARDLPGIAMLACIFGCDALFEDGYISVDGGRVIGTSTVGRMSAIGRRVRELHGRIVPNYSQSAAYFQWHLQNVFLA
ncbi:hypothetical protein ES689_06160 [Frigoribacterium sp. ACAM 257]|uniref:hypothetical protein n=1 Tax=Frigoribacterium sp. ACAM 257 TaxID=2508998 RepID=UPI0011B99128|nr:hypothetical protein [Frigoribacterium sp. ACAM 257]TWX40970.1 hypothetical protein ES689_06160 [Frigoribacterium sp. ACAM 257]